MLYAVGGSNGAASVVATEAYDPLANAWALRAPLPAPQVQVAIGVVNNILYAVGGAPDPTFTGFLSTVEAYNPVTNTWITKAAMPTPRRAHAVAVVNSVLYAVGGFNGAYLNTVEAYDPATNIWTTKAPMPTPRAHPAAGAVNGILYVVGGCPNNPCSQHAVGTVEAYDPTSNTWTTKAAMPTPRAALGIGVVNGVLYAVGGFANGAIHVNTVEAYDPTTNTWTTQAPMPTPRDLFGSVGVLNSVLYAVAGARPPDGVESYPNEAGLTTNEAFTPLGPSTPGKVTGGGQIAGDPVFTVDGVLISAPALVPSLADPKSQATFGFVVQLAVGGGTPTGNLDYNDHPAGVRIKAASYSGLFITTGTCGPNTHATISGTATVIRSTGTTTESMTVDVDDCGQAGAMDKFGITTDSYSNGPSTLIAGNITINSVACDCWVTKAPLPTALYGMGAATINRVLYVVGGVNDRNEVVGTVEAYDPATNTWSPRASLPTPRFDLGATVINGVLYAVGGYTYGYPPRTTVEAYDPTTDTWTTKASMPTGRGLLGVAAINGILYAVGGDGGPRETVEAYDPATNTWTTKASMPTGREGLGVTAINGILYAVGGDQTGLDELATVEAYDPATNTWTTKASMPTKREGLGVTAINGILYAVGGDQNASGGTVLATLEAYDPARNTWTTRASMPTARWGLGVAALNGMLFAVGGVNNGPRATVEAYSP
jgi:N-acetylneuraminic acid mutarotase